MIGVMPDLAQAMHTIVHQCLAIRRDEDVLVRVDEATAEIGQPLREEARRVGADAVLAVMDERATDGTEPPPILAAALAACDVFIAPTSRSLSHTTARKLATDGGARGATMPGADADMLARVMAVDFEQMAARSRDVANLLDEGNTAHITCPRGSDATLDLSGRHAIADDGDLRAPGSFGNLPCGEGFIAPLTGDGRIVVASLAPLGISDEPVALEMRPAHRGGSGGLGPEYLELLKKHGEAGTNLAELGVGTNDRARLTGKVLEDEKILGTVPSPSARAPGSGERSRCRSTSTRWYSKPRLRSTAKQCWTRVASCSTWPRHGNPEQSTVSPMTLLAVPNVSAGRDPPRRADRPGLRRAPARRDSDPDHNRSVFTLAGEPGQLAFPVFNGARRLLELIDLSDHDGMHPRVGVIDVAPIVYLDDATRGQACAEALVLGDLLGHELGVPVFLYGALPVGALAPNFVGVVPIRWRRASKTASSLRTSDPKVSIRARERCWWRPAHRWSPLTWSSPHPPPARKPRRSPP